MPKPHLLFRFVPTMACNYRCSYCFVPSAEKTQAATLFDQHRPDEWVSAMARWSGYDVEFYCWGGEPFLLDGTYDIVRGWTAQPHVLHGCRLDTNLSFAARIAAECPSDKVQLNCSWHPEYDTLARLQEKVRLLHEVGMVGMVNLVASERNLRLVEGRYGTTCDALVKQFEDSGIFLNIAADFTLLDRLSGDDYTRYKEFILRYQAPEDWKHLRCETEPSLCLANQHFFTVYPNGDIRPCLTDTVCGNFFDGWLTPPPPAVCTKRCPSLVAYPFRTDNAFPSRDHLREYVRRTREHRRGQRIGSTTRLGGRMAGLNEAGTEAKTAEPAPEIGGRLLAAAGAREKTPRVSVVMPVWNAERYIDEAIQSVLSQTAPDFELVVVDDGSTDGTKAYLRTLRDPRIRIIEHERNRRLPQALNTGFRAARGELLTWVSADNYCAPLFLEALAAALDANPDAGVACAAFAWIDEAGRITGVHRDQDFGLASLLAGNPGNAAFLYRRSCQDAVGFYDPDLEGAEDWDMWLRIRERFEFVYVPEILYYYRLHSRSMTATMGARIREAARQTFQRALARLGGQIPLGRLYPALGACQDQRVARRDACVDLGARLLAASHCDAHMAEIAEALFLAAQEAGPASPIVALNLALARARLSRWDEAERALDGWAGGRADVGEEWRRVAAVVRSRGRERAAQEPPVVPDRAASELHARMAASRRVFAFTGYATESREPWAPLCADMPQGRRMDGAGAVQDAQAADTPSHSCSRPVSPDSREEARMTTGTETAEQVLPGQMMAAIAPTEPQPRPSGSPLRIVAIIAAYNEGDVIYHVIGDLIANGVDVYLIDHCSTDSTAQEAGRWLGKGLVRIERFPQDSGYPTSAATQYVWHDILRRKAEIAHEMRADWYIHADADEFREAPWPDVSLAEAIRIVDDLGYNAIDFEVLNFCPTDDRFEPGSDVREHLRLCRPAAACDQVQIKAWKNPGVPVVLERSGGHQVEFSGRRVFPIPFILRHYPIRGETHGRRKLHQDRQPRFVAEERRMGWHVQYDQLQDGSRGFLEDPSTLTPYNPSVVRARLLARASLALLRRDTEIQTEESANGDGHASDPSVRFGFGFFEDEGDWRWMGPQAFLDVAPGVAAIEFSLRCGGRAHYDGFPFEVAILTDGTLREGRRFSESDQEHHIRLRLEGRDRTRRIELRSAEYFVPARRGEGNDRRTLALLFGRLRVERLRSAAEGAGDGHAADPDASSALQRGDMALASHAWADACEAFIAVLDNGQGCARARAGLGLGLLGLGSQEEGIAQLQEAVRLEPSPDLVTNLACGFMHVGRLAEAERLLEGVVAVAPTHEAARFNLARLREARGAVVDA